MDPVSFGLSSGFFYISWIYAYYTTTRIPWLILLFLLPISSYLCNTNIKNPTYYIFDQTIIVLISCTYLFYQDMVFLPSLIITCFLFELFYKGKLMYVVLIAFILQIICACTLFGYVELALCAICVLTSSYCYYKRDPLKYSYAYYTILWHAACVGMLMLGTRTLIDT